MVISKNLAGLEGPLPKMLPLATIGAANEAALATSKQPLNNRPLKRGSYMKLTGAQQYR